MKAGAAAAAAALVLLWGAAWAQDDELPRIFLEKKVFAETKSGKKSFYEVHAVEEGESLWKIFHRRGPLPPEDYAALLREFRRVNPQVADPDRLKPGEQVFVPSVPPRLADRRIAEGAAVAYRVEEGDTLTEILAGRGVERAEMAEYLAAVRELNESVRDVNLIYAGRTLLLPTERHFAAAPAPEGEAVAAATPLTKDAPPSAGAGELPAAKPEAQLGAQTGSDAPLAGGVVAPRRAGDNAALGEGPSAWRAEGALPQPKPPYRGLLSDLMRGIGEKWMDRGMLYLPVPSGGEVVLPLEDYPVARFSTGVEALIDFRSTLPGDVRAVVEGTWKSYRVVGLGDAQGPTEMIDRLLRSSGYHSVKDGLARPLVIGEAVAVSIPARWVVLRTEKSLLAGEVILVKEVPEKPGYSLSAALRYADRVGIRVLPYAVDPSAREGFVVGVEEGSGEEDAESAPTLARGGLAAVDSSLAFLGIAPIGEERLTIGGKGGAFRLTIEPERVFAAGGKRYVVDTGKMSPAVRAIVRDSGYAIFSVGKDETGSSIFRRIAAAAGLASEERRDFLLAGGETEGFEVRATGLFITSADWLGSRNLRAAVAVRGRVHPATRALLRDFGVEIVGWSS